MSISMFTALTDFPQNDLFDTPLGLIGQVLLGFALGMTLTRAMEFPQLKLEAIGVGCFLLGLIVLKWVLGYDYDSRFPEVYQCFFFFGVVVWLEMLIKVQKIRRERQGK